MCQVVERIICWLTHHDWEEVSTYRRIPTEGQHTRWTIWHCTFCHTEIELPYREKPR